MAAESGEHPPAHDPRVLRAIAHPIRNRILDELDAGGPVRAADVAQELGIPANQASFHLRQLAKYGLVEEAADLARDRRDRVWRLTSEAGFRINIAELEKQPGGTAAAAVWRDHASGWAHHAVDAAYRSGGDEGTFRAIANHSVRLTREEAQQLATELDEVAQRWADRTRGRDPERRTYLLMSILQPHPDR